ncbi:glycoside hydrolase family 32 protein [Natronospirillum operosum]|uniref:Glycoside hydrolase family 32 protein n=1 Tax=Natronospirillum operosum TaxID=2759953 RepID=A0A4Z0WD22_9GAMM|nr:glycoside hydrolase family 32 protein [Natronospirillum operosum]TGG92900.1 glycoside hydrolase family 32 protein [Natronospirillum operosum]
MQAVDTNVTATSRQPDYRPQYHFSAERHWINDPNGLVWIDGLYHLFYQCNPFGTRWGNMSWGHAVSRDLVTWQEQPIALPQRELAERTEAIFSGCCVLDKDNVSGLGEAGQQPLLAFYTSHYSTAPKPMGRQAQSLAYSLDAGDSWQFYGGVPLIHLHQDNAQGYDADEFRDPKVFYHAASGYWIMVLVLAKDRKVIFYRSRNLLDWEAVSTFSDPGNNPGDLWEVPDLVEMRVGNSDDTRWVLLLSINTEGAHRQAGSTQHYFVGDFDGREFHFNAADNPPVRDGAHPGYNRLDWGRDYYAAVSFHNEPGSEPLVIAWMNNWQYANDIPHQGFRGQMTLARRLHLRQQDGQYRPVSEPVRPRLQNETERALVPDHALGHREAMQVRLPATTQRLSLNTCGFSDGELELYLHFGEDILAVHLDARRGIARLDRSGLTGSHLPAQFAACDSAHELNLADASLVIYLDRSSVEVFGREGLWSITQQIFPSAPLGAVSVRHTQSTPLQVQLSALQTG